MQTRTRRCLGLSGGDDAVLARALGQVHGLVGASARCCATALSSSGASWVTPALKVMSTCSSLLRK